MNNVERSLSQEVAGSPRKVRARLGQVPTEPLINRKVPEGFPRSKVSQKLNSKPSRNSESLRPDLSIYILPYSCYA